MSQPSILVFDSGIGGLSIVHSIRSVAPWIHINYIADLGYHPYGPRSDKDILDRVTKVLRKTVPSVDPDLIVIACNTASTAVLNELREAFPIPFVGVVPAIKPAVAMSDSATIGVLATEGTVTRSYTKNLIHQFAQNKSVFLYGSAALVNIAEAKFKGDDVNMELIAQEVENLTRLSQDIDTIVLACTHFPIINAELSRALPHIKYWVDSGAAIAKRTVYCLEILGYRDKVVNKDQANHNLFLITAKHSTYKKEAIHYYLGPFEEVFLNI